MHGTQFSLEVTKEETEVKRSLNEKGSACHVGLCL